MKILHTPILCKSTKSNHWTSTGSSIVESTRNNLVENIGGPKVAGIGFAIGLERLFLALEKENIDISECVKPDLYVISIDEDLKAFKLVNYLRLCGFNTEMDYSQKGIKSNFKKADKLGAKYIIIIGEDEAKSGILTIKDNESKEEYKIDIENIVEFLDGRLLNED